MLVLHPVTACNNAPIIIEVIYIWGCKNIANFFCNFLQLVITTDHCAKRLQKYFQNFLQYWRTIILEKNISYFNFERIYSWFFYGTRGFWLVLRTYLKTSKNVSFLLLQAFRIRKPIFSSLFFSYNNCIIWA